MLSRVDFGNLAALSFEQAKAAPKGMANGNTFRAIETNIGFRGRADGGLTRGNLRSLIEYCDDHLRGYRGQRLVNDILAAAGYAYTDNNIRELKRTAELYLQKFKDPNGDGKMTRGDAPTN